LGRRVAGLELGDEGMGEKVILCVVVVTFQGGIEN